MVSQITCHKMSNIYLTLVSDVTKKYTSNVANQFKVKPQLRLPREGWKVSVAGAIFYQKCLCSKNYKVRT